MHESPRRWSRTLPLGQRGRGRQRRLATQSPGEIREELRSLSNVFCLPHIASATRESRMQMALRTLANINAYFETGAPLDRVV